MTTTNGGTFAFLSTPSARRATLYSTVFHVESQLISIHALREEGDLCQPHLDRIQLLISIHALREEGD